MITTSISNILQARTAIETLTKAALPAKKSYEITKLLKALTVEFEAFEAARVEAVKRYGTEAEDGSFTVDPSNQEFVKEINELVTTEITVDREKVDLSQHLDQLEFTVSDLIALEPFFNFE